MIQEDPNLTCDENHVYRYKGVVRPGVSEIMQGAGIVGDYRFAEYARLRGVYTHQVAELHDRGTLDYSSVHSELVPYFKQYTDFLFETGAVPVLIEFKLYDPVLQFCGRLDRVFEVGKELWLTDLKTGQVQRWAAIQTKGYEKLLMAQPWIKELLKGRPLRRKVLQLTGEGKYRKHDYDSPTDGPVFESALNIFNWKNRMEDSDGK